MLVQDICKGNEIVAKVIKELEYDIRLMEIKNDIPRGYLKTVLALHIPRFSLNEIHTTKGEINESFLLHEAHRLAIILRERIQKISMSYHGRLMSTSKRSRVSFFQGKIIELSLIGSPINLVEFKNVDPDVGFLIQENLHYIGKSRYDTLFHFGLFRSGENFPFAYCAFSVLDRKYLLEALPQAFEMGEVLVLTRSFSVNDSPVNSMSMLVAFAIKNILANFPNKYKFIVTAVNPNVMFKGTAFKASTFFPFATVPFLPYYYKGNYCTRKSLNRMNVDYKEVEGAKIKCEPVVWMGRPLQSSIPKYFSRRNGIFHVVEESYILG